MNNTKIQKNVEAGAKTTLSLFEVNIKNFSTLADIQINLVDNYVKNSIANVESFKKIKDHKTFQDYLLSLKDQTEEGVNKTVQGYVDFTANYAQEVAQVLNTQAIKTQ